MSDSPMILVADDQPLSQVGLLHLLESDPRLNARLQACALADVLDVVAREKPSLVILDLGLRGAEGVTLIKRIRAQSQPPLVLASAIFDERIYAERAMRAGAAGFFSKQDSPELVREAVRTVMDGKISLSSELQEGILQRLTAPSESANVTPEESLSDRELEVFSLLGLGLTTREIASRLQLSIKTINTYRDLLKRKLGEKSNPALIRRAVLWVLEQGDAAPVAWNAASGDGGTNPGSNNASLATDAGAAAEEPAG